VYRRQKRIGKERTPACGHVNAADYPEDYRHGVDPSPKPEMVYTPKAREASEFVLDYFIPIREK